MVLFLYYYDEKNYQCIHKLIKFKSDKQLYLLIIKAKHAKISIVKNMKDPMCLNLFEYIVNCASTNSNVIIMRLRKKENHPEYP